MNDVFRRPHSRSRWSWLALTLLCVLTLSFLVACGSDDDDDSGTSANATNTTSGGASSSTVASPTMNGSTAELGQIGTCFATGLTGNVVTDLRAGKTDSAQTAFTACLNGTLPESMVAMAQPIVQQAATCASDASKQLSDADVTALQNGDTAKAQTLANDTLTCASDKLGVPLSGM